MNNRKPASLYPKDDEIHQIEVLFNPYMVIIASVVFALIFFAIGSLWRYYLVIGA